jgi:hypothetical protein
MKLSYVIVSFLSKKNSIVPIAPLSWSRSAALSTLTKRSSIGILLLVPKRKNTVREREERKYRVYARSQARWRYFRECFKKMQKATTDSTEHSRATSPFPPHMTLRIFFSCAMLRCYKKIVKSLLTFINFLQKISVGFISA